MSEALIREALHPYGHVRVGTKAGYTRQGPDQWTVVGHPAYLRQCAQRIVPIATVQNLRTAPRTICPDSTTHVFDQGRE